MIKIKKTAVILILLFAATVFCGCSLLGDKENQEAEAPAEEAEEVVEEIPFVAPSAIAEGSNGINNIYCAGLSYDAGDICYYIKEADDGSGVGTIRAIHSDGSDTLLYTAEGNIEYLSATTDKLYFVVTIYKGNGHFKEDRFCSLDRATTEVTEHFTCTDRVIAISVRTDGIYLCTTTERSGSKMLLTDALGRSPEVLWEQDDIITDCVFSGENVIFLSNNRLWQSTLKGENKTELCSSLYMLGSPMVVGETIYFTSYDSYLCPTLSRLNTADGIITPLISYGENIRISALNLYANQIYLVKSTVDVEGNTQSAEIVSLYTDGSGETQLFTAETEVYGLSISQNSLFYYDLAAGKAIRTPLTIQ